MHIGFPGSDGSIDQQIFVGIRIMYRYFGTNAVIFSVAEAVALGAFMQGKPTCLYIGKDLEESALCYISGDP